MANLNTPAFYDAYWGSDQCAAYMRDRQLDIIAEHIVGRIGAPPLMVMDIGGGVSRIARLAKAAGHNPFVVDFSQAAVDRMRAEGIDAAVYDLSKWKGLILTQYADVVTCTEVLEHLRRPEQAVRMAAAHAKRAFFTVPDNCMGPKECATHLRTFTGASLTELLCKHWGRVDVQTMFRWLVAECEA